MVGIATAFVVGVWTMAIGLALGGGMTLVGGAQLVRRSLVPPMSNRLLSALADRNTFVVRAVLGTVPPIFVGLVTLVIGLQYPAAMLLAGIFLSMALSFALIYLAIWSARPDPQVGR